MMRMVILGLLGVQTLTALAQGTATNEPLPGTREYYTLYVEGRYCYVNGDMMPVAGLKETLGDMATPGVIQAVQHLYGRVEQIASSNAVIVRTTRRMPSGATEWKYVVLRLEAVTSAAVGQEIATNVASDGAYTCWLASGKTNILAGYRLSEKQPTTTRPTISFEQYAELFDRQNRKVPLEHVTRLIRSDVVRPLANAYRDRLRERMSAAQTNAPEQRREELQKRLQQYQMEQIRKGQTPLPMSLSKEMDDQLVKEAVLAPDVQSPTGKAHRLPVTD